MNYCNVCNVVQLCGEAVTPVFLTAKWNQTSSLCTYQML